MNEQKAKRARGFAYFCVGLAIGNFAIYVAKSLFVADSDPSPALLIIGMAMLIAGSIAFARAKKASEE
ncbi:MAG TPA: hypothetical protein VM557_12135 [Thermoanaerobaculia bacterium]|nr:hypothetical protein [Thermoanaerobaculia bacterium]